MRLPDWVERLHKTIEAASERPFDYGSFNCGLFAAQCIDAITASTRVAELSAQFHDEASAKAFVDRAGSIADAVTERLGTPSPSWAAARRGDICLVPTQDGPGLGVCVGQHIAMMTPTTGVTYVKIDQAQRVWRID